MRRSGSRGRAARRSGAGRRFPRRAFTALTEDAARSGDEDALAGEGAPAQEEPSPEEGVAPQGDE